MVLDDQLSKEQHRQLATLRGRSRKRLFGIATIVVLLSFAVVFTLSELRDYRLEHGGMPVLRAKISMVGAPWAKDFIDTYDSYYYWLEYRGTETERSAFNSVAYVLGTSLISSADISRSRSSLRLLTRLYHSLHFAVLRLSFVAIGLWRIWLFLIVAAFVYARFTSKPRAGDDLLGRSGNGRHFYSGIRAGLDEVTPEGAPAVQVPGLACPAESKLSEITSTRLYRLLEKHDALNSTNKHLVAILHAHKHMPGFIAELGHEDQLEKRYQGCGLLQTTEIIIDVLFEARESYVEAALTQDERQHETLPEFGEHFGPETYAKFLSGALTRAHGADMKRLIRSVPASLLATVFLAQQAGKVLAYSHEGGRWIRRSRFPLLCARSVLHSVKDYSRDYDFYERQDIRQSIIYGSRESIFGPVRFARDMSDRARAIRQWVEILHATPVEVVAATDSVELFGLMVLLQKRFKASIYDRLSAAESEIFSESVAIDTGLLMIPAKRLVELFRDIALPHKLERLEVLAVRVSQQQRIESISRELSNDEERAPVPKHERVLEAFHVSQIDQLAQEHGIDRDLVKAWSSLRVVLNGAGWLARRVGDYSVPDSSLVLTEFSGMRQEGRVLSSSEERRKGMVPLRGSRFEEEWGSDWQERFVRAKSALIAESKKDFARVKREESPEAGLPPIAI